MRIKIKITRAVVPNLFTILNMFSGFISVIASSDGNFIYAANFILVAALFDILDGVMARLTKSSSEFGVQIDSLADVISFGIAPAFLAYKIYLFQFGEIGLLISSLLMVMAGIRLARFNIQLVGFDKNHFSGLPSPASGLTIVAFILTFYDSKNGFNSEAVKYFPALVILVSLLMVSLIKYDTLPKLSKKGFQEKPFHVVSLFFSLFLIFITNGKALFYIIIAFIIFGVLRSTINVIKKKSFIATTRKMKN